MKIFKTIEDLQEELNLQRQRKTSIGFVPTMGALHDGHLSLIQRSLRENPITVCSIFVNQTQFNSAADFSNYPRTEDTDIGLLEKTGCNFIFIPSHNEMYPTGKLLDINFGILETTMEGVFRPGHFKGVATVVKKFFDIIQPDAAYFGEKDFQQLVVINNMTKQFEMNVRIIGCETIREVDGLAMSSRNIHLTEMEREKANEIYHTLLFARELYDKKMPAEKIKEQIINRIKTKTPFTIQYFEIVHSETMQPLHENDYTVPVHGCIAVLTSKTRLIDNISLT